MTVGETCGTCFFWKYLWHEADGRDQGRCDRLSRQKWRYDFLSVKVLENHQEAFDIVVRSDFGCNQYENKHQPAKSNT